MRFLKSAACGAALFAALPALAETYEIKVAHFVAPRHFMSEWLVKWGEDLEKKSGGRLKVKQFPGAQMGPPPVYYDLVRKGRVEVAWFLHGGTPGRFPLTELINLPYTVGSAEIGTKVLNDAELRAKYLDAEHKGVKVLMLLTHQPGNIHTREKPVRTVEDMKGLRLRFASPTIKLWISGLGGAPVGLPPTAIAENLQKGAIDGVFIDYGGAGIAFKLGGMIKYTTEMYSYVGSFGVGMNPEFFKKLPKDLQKLVEDSVKGHEAEVGKGWDALDAAGKKLLVAGGMTPIKLSAAENERFKKIGDKVSEDQIKELEGKGLPARAVYDMMKSLAAKHEATSMSFWK